MLCDKTTKNAHAFGSDKTMFESFDLTEGGIFVFVCGAVLVVISLLFFYVLSTTYRRTVETMRQEAETSIAKYRVAENEVAQLQDQIYRLKVTVLQRDKEIEEIKSKNSE